MCMYIYIYTCTHISSSIVLGDHLDHYTIHFYRLSDQRGWMGLELPISQIRKIATRVGMTSLLYSWGWCAVADCFPGCTCCLHIAHTIELAVHLLLEQI